MITKLVKRYYCEHCRKGGQTKAIASHELTCIKNPGRQCYVCHEFGIAQALMPDLLAAAEDSLEALRELTPCPACILAALAQRHQAHPETEWREFDYKLAMQELRDEHTYTPYT